MHQNLFIWFSKHGVHKFGRTTKWTNRQTDKWTNEHVENILPSPSSMTRQRHKTKHYITVTFITHARIPVLTSVCVRSISFYVDDEPKQFTSIHQAEHHSSPLPLWSSASFITTTTVKLDIAHHHYNCEARHRSSLLQLWSSASFITTTTVKLGIMIPTTTVKLGIVHHHYHCEARHRSSPLQLWSSASLIPTTTVKLGIVHHHYHCEAQHHSSPLPLWSCQRSHQLQRDDVKITLDGHLRGQT